mmetsp:Transcript_35095/g.62740  ORF Transcript_35095/g.62740 Transcript_35095/m.62740 type:complete len:95 (-) Transcript_35095:888-1172(-)
MMTNTASKRKGSAIPALLYPAQIMTLVQSEGTCDDMWTNPFYHSRWQYRTSPSSVIHNARFGKAQCSQQHWGCFAYTTLCTQQAQLTRSTWLAS